VATGNAASAERLVNKVLARGGGLGEELGIDLRGDGPSAWFRLLCAAMLSGARIRSSIALAAARGLAEAGWTSPEALAASSWEERVRVLDEAGYARYDERTATALGRLAEELRQRYGGDLRRLRDEAGRQAPAERRLLNSLG
jgi:hypothetical protein